MPHAGGGLPSKLKAFLPRYQITPLRWGSTAIVLHSSPCSSDYPTPVGFYPSSATPRTSAAGLPHPRGCRGMPRGTGGSARTWTGLPRRRGDLPEDPPAEPLWDHLPRRRGDPPYPKCSTSPRLEIAPRRWGSTMAEAPLTKWNWNCPTQVGDHPISRAACLSYFPITPRRWGSTRW